MPETSMYLDRQVIRSHLNVNVKAMIKFRSWVELRAEFPHFKFWLWRKTVNSFYSQCSFEYPFFRQTQNLSVRFFFLAGIFTTTQRVILASKRNFFVKNVKNWWYICLGLQKSLTMLNEKKNHVWGSLVAHDNIEHEFILTAIKMHAARSQIDGCLKKSF